MAARTWTLEQRQRQAEAIRRWSPWEQSTGPKSKPGKALVSRNSWKGGEWRKLREMVKAFNQAMRDQRDMLE
ncbi:MAG: hypothetical protein B7Y69_08260 [Sphingobacteriia bacterium 35-40-8]|nr:MAG: hypothetical protein B7Y69_08260 [Sphingobacteriia bacterium 35-40-8]